MATKKNITVDELLNAIPVSKTRSKIDYTPYIKGLKEYESLIGIGSFFVSLFDLSTSKCVYVTPSITDVLGYSTQEWLYNDLSYIFSHYHPNTLTTQRSVYLKVLNFYQNLSIQTRLKYLFSYDVLIRHKKSNYVHLLKFNKVLKFDSYGRPILLLVFCVDITDYKIPNSHVLVISKSTKTGLKKVLRLDFYNEYENGILTKKEMEIHLLIQQGLTSNEIATKLGLSVHTVNTHRKRILKKIRKTKQ